MVDQNGGAVSDITLNPPNVNVPSGNRQVDQNLTIEVNPNAQTGSRPLKLKATSGNINRQTDLTINVQRGSGSGGGDSGSGGGDSGSGGGDSGSGGGDSGSGGGDSGSGGGDSGSGGGSITLTVEDPAGNFVAAAYQVGTGSWQPLSMSGGTTKTGSFDLGSQTKYGVAVRCRDEVAVVQATSTELDDPKIVCSSQAPSTVSVTVEVTISGIQVEDGDKVCVNDQRCSSLTQGATSTTISARLEPGTRDLLITLRKGSNEVKVAKVERNVVVTDGGSIQVSLESNDERTEVPFNVQAPPGYTAFPVISYLSANRTAWGSVNASFTDYTYRPVSGFGGGDLYMAWIVAYSPNNPNQLMSWEFFDEGSAAPSFELPAPWTNGSLTVTRHPHPTVGGLSRSGGGLKCYAISLSSGQLNYTAFLSKGWLGGDTSYQLPDLSDANLLNYNAPQGNVSISVAAVQSNKTVLITSFFNNAVPSDLEAGDHFKMATAHTSFTVDENDSNPISFP